MKIHNEEKLRDQFGIPLFPLAEDHREIYVKTLNYPTLLISYRAHLRPITSINYVDDRELVLTASVDCTIRLFTLTGRYVGCFGQNISENLTDRRVPDDIRRKGSAITLQTLRGDVGKRWKLLKNTIVAWTSLPIFRTFCKKKKTNFSLSLVVPI